MRAVLDVNVVVSALLSRNGAPGRLVASWLAGGFELVVSEGLLDVLARALTYAKLRAFVNEQDAIEFIDLLRSTASMVVDTPKPPPVCADPYDDHLIALATKSDSILVSGDRELLALSPRLPIYSPAAFLALLES